MIRTRHYRAFTLIELMVAMAVLGIMLLFLSQMVTMASKMWTASRAHADNFAQTRVVLGIMDRDIRAMVLRPDLAAFMDSTGKPTCAFYTRMLGPDQLAANARKLSLVSYEMDTVDGKPSLQRRDQGFSYGGGDSPKYQALTSMDMAGAAAQPLVEGVVDFKIQFVQADGKILPDTGKFPTNNGEFPFDFSKPSEKTNVRAVILSLLVLDAEALELADTTNRISALKGAFGGTPANDESYATYWEGLLSSGGTLSSYPEPIRRGLKAFQRVVVLPVSVTQ